MRIAAFVLMLAALAACHPAEPAVAAPATVATAQWTRITEAAPYPGSYNFPVFAADSQAYAVLPEGTWSTADGAEWRREPLPFSGLNSAYLKYVQHDGAVYALGVMTGNYLDYTIDPTIRRTRDFKTWETVGAAPTLPGYIFYAAISFKGAIWLVGGADASGPKAEIWRSADGLHWTRVVDKAPWSARSSAQLVVFRDRLWLIGGGVIDGPQANDVWSSSDGVTWARETAQIAPERPMGTAVAFNDALWLIGASRSGSFTAGTLVSPDGKTWVPMNAPWTPRGGVATWIMDDDLYITGGKYSRPKPGGQPGELEFIYSHDVWRMEGD